MDLNYLLGDPHWDEVISEFSYSHGADVKSVINYLLEQKEKRPDNPIVGERVRVVQSSKRVREIIVVYYLVSRFNRICPQTAERGIRLTKKEYKVMIQSFVEELRFENDLSRLFKMVLASDPMTVDINSENDFLNFLNKLRNIQS